MYVGFLILLLFCLQPLWFTDSQELKYLNIKELNLEAIYLISQKTGATQKICLKIVITLLQKVVLILCKSIVAQIFYNGEIPDLN